MLGSRTKGSSSMLPRTFRSAMSRAIAITAVLLAGIFSAAAHEGHDLGGQPQPTAHVLPRGEATAGPFQLVGVANADEVTLWLDDFATNRPIATATLDIETARGPVAATPGPEDGSFRLKTPWFAVAGYLDLAVTVRAGDAVEILALTIGAGEAKSADASAEAASSPAWTPRVGALARPVVVSTLAGGIAAGLLLAGLFGRRRAAVPLAAVGLLATIGFGLLQQESIAREDRPANARPPAPHPTASAIAERA